MELQMERMVLVASTPLYVVPELAHLQSQHENKSG